MMLYSDCSRDIVFTGGLSKRLLECAGVGRFSVVLLERGDVCCVSDEAEAIDYFLTEKEAETLA